MAKRKAIGSKLAINSFEDVADSEDEFHINRDKVLLDEGPDAKRRRKWAEEDAALEQSDEEILGYSSESSDDDEEDSQTALDLEDENGAEAEEEEEEGWGSSRKDYYNADEIQTEADALEEEAEARRLQKKKLSKMTDADFGLDDFGLNEDEWKSGAAANEDENGDVVTEVLKDIEITEDTPPEERMRILRTRYPEFDPLADEFVALQPVLTALQADTEATTPAPKQVILKCRALAAYMASLGMYFALLTSPARDQGIAKTMPPDELHDHPVMESILQCRNLWNKVKSMKVPVTNLAPTSPSTSLEVEEETIQAISKPITQTKTKKQSSTAKDLNFSDLDALLSSRSSSKLRSKTLKETLSHNNPSDFGEEAPNTSGNLRKSKKSLKFYTSQITQKANKRSTAGKEAGGDADLPYKERHRDRIARLNAEAEARGQAQKPSSSARNNLGAPLDPNQSDDDEGDNHLASEIRNASNNEYYDLIASSASAKKAEKAARKEALKNAAERGVDRVVEEEMDGEGKRAIGYTIEKNKGLAPKRKKDVRNPRVKKRKKFEEKKKKLGSMKAVYKGGEERGGYGGEKTGIKSGLVRSVKL